MGILLGLLTALFFGIGTVMVRVGMHGSPRNDGLYMTVFVNVLILGVVGLSGPKPEWSTKGVAILAVAGVVGTAVGRYANLRAIRFVGATRSSVFVTGTPVAAAVAGWIILDESVGLVDAAGGVLVVGGLLLLSLRGAAAAAVAGSETVARPTVTGYVFAAISPVLFGLAFALRKLGLRSYDSAVMGAFIGALAALVSFSLMDLATGNVRARFRENFTGINWWFVGAGASISLALIAQFWAFDFVPAWVVGALQGTQALLVAVLGYIFMRTDEHIDRIVVTSMLLVAAGVTLITVAL